MLWLPKWLHDDVPVPLARADTPALDGRPLLPGAGARADELLPGGVRLRLPGGDEPELRPQGGLSRRTFLFLGASAAVGALVAPTIGETLHLVTPNALTWDELAEFKGWDPGFLAGRRGGKSAAVFQYIQQVRLLHPSRCVLLTNIGPPTTKE